MAVPCRISNQLEIKKTLFSQLDRFPEQAIIASNTSSFTINTLTSGMKSPQRVVGLHFFNPAHIIPTVEVHTGDATTDDVIRKTRDLMIQCGKKPILALKTLPGFVINRLTGAMEREIDYLLDEGVVTPEDLDAAVKGSYGFRLACLGPMEAGDCLSGIDRSLVDGLYFASITPPYKEKQSAAFVAAVLGLKKTTVTADFGGSLRCGTNALQAAIDAVKVGSLKNVLVCASDMRISHPMGNIEMTCGDGSAAVLIGRSAVIAEIENCLSLYDEIQDVWRSDRDFYMRLLGD